jgi:plastocyanin
MSVWMKMACVLLLMTAVACGKTSSPTSPTTTAAVTIIGGGFTPNSVNISVGSTVMWMNEDSAAHAVVANDGSFSSGSIAAGGHYSYAFPTAGTFTYHDSSNATMVGTVTVSGSSSPSPY